VLLVELLVLLQLLLQVSHWRQVQPARLLLLLRLLLLFVRLQNKRNDVGTGHRYQQHVIHKASSWYLKGLLAGMKAA
jgi:hypothetical protein